MKKLFIFGLCLLLLVPSALGAETLIWDGSADGIYTAIHQNAESSSYTGACAIILPYNTSFDNITTVSIYNAAEKDSGTLRVFLSYMKSDGSPHTTTTNQTYMDYYDIAGYSASSGWNNLSIIGGLSMDTGVSSFALGYSSPSSGATADCQYQTAIGQTKKYGFRRENWNMIDDKYLTIKIFADDSGPPPVPSSFPWIKINVSDAYDGSAVEGVTVTLAGGLSNITNAAGVATFNHSGDVSFNVSDPESRYFDYSSSVNAVENTTNFVNVTGAFVELSAFDVLGGSVSGFGVAAGGHYNYSAGASVKLLLPPEANTSVTFNKSGWYDVVELFETVGQDDGSFNTSLMHDSEWEVTAVDVLDNSSIGAFNVTVANGSYSHELSTTTGNITFWLVQGIYNFLIDAPVSPLANETMAVNASGGYEFVLYPVNSLFLSFFETFTGFPLLQNVTVDFSGGSFFSRTNDTGSMIVKNLSVGTWTLDASAVGFEDSVYYVTVADRSTQEVDVFLLNSSFGGETTFTIKDSTTGNVIEGAVMTMQQLVDGSWATIGQGPSDVFGIVFWSLIQGDKYKFIVEAPTYATKTGNFTRTTDAYTISLSQSNTQNFISYLGDFTYRIDQDCGEGVSNFSMVVSSPLGKLEWFSASVSVNGTTNTTNVTASPAGGTVLTSLDLSSFNGYTAYGVYRVKSVNMDDPLVLSRACVVRVIGAGNYTFADFMDYYGDDGGGELSTGVQALLLTIVAVLVAAALGVFFGLEAAMVGAAVVFIMGGIFSWLDWGVVIVIDALLFGLMLIGGRR